MDGSSQVPRVAWIRRPIATAGALFAATGLVAVLLLAAGGPASAGPATVDPSLGPITLVFAGQADGDNLGPITDAHPPVEGGDLRTYLVPANRRLIIDSVFIETTEWWQDGVTGPRSGISAGIVTSYPLPTCAFPGYERDYFVILTDQVVQGGSEPQSARAGELHGPIYVEGRRVVQGTAFMPGGDSTVWVYITVHGRLEAATNPKAPTFDCG
jgi:hypothetical protein